MAQNKSASPRQYLVRNQRGFTIIEVVLVLAIAGLIFLIVFLAIPTLQRSRRDTQRKSDIALILSALNRYRSQNGNLVPVGAAETDAFEAAFVTTQGLTDPSTGTPYDLVWTAVAPVASPTIHYAAGYQCGNNGQLVSVGAATARQVAQGFSTRLESGPFCLDNE